MRTISFFLLNALLFSCISLLVRLSAANILGNETDRLALLAFKSQINQGPLSSWNDYHHFCEWEGVTCSPRHHRVTVLNLNSRGLVGSISPFIGNLSFLRALALQWNKLEGEIPQELGLLFRLENLYLGHNALVGKVPVNISHCSKLIAVQLRSNNLVGEIPVELESLSKLVMLGLDSNKLTGRIPPFLGNLTSLEIISISENNYFGGIPSSLGQLKSLKILALGLCNLSGMFPSSLYNLSALEIISVTLNNNLTGNLPTDLHLPNLKYFFIAGNHFSGPIPAALFNASGLERVDMGVNQFTGKIPLNTGNLKNLTRLLLHANNLGSAKSGDLDFITSMANCSNLQQLSISANRFGGMLPAYVANFSNLETLYMFKNQISGKIPFQIGNLQNLIGLDLSSNFLTGSIPISIGNLQNVGELHIQSNYLSGCIPSSIRNMSKLYSLNLSSNDFEGSIASSLGNQNLQLLDLSHNNLTSTIPIQEIGQSSRLINLILSHNSLNGFIPLEVSNLKNIQYLDVSENKMTGEIPHTLGSCTSLEYIYFQGNFLQGPLPSTLSSLKGLQVLDVSHNNLTGKVPKELGNLLVLRWLNLSFNNLEGEIPINGIFGNTSAISVKGNDKLCGGIPKLKLVTCNIHKSKRQGIPLALAVILGLLVLSLLMVAVFLVIYMKKKPRERPPSEQFPENFRRVSYNDLHRATDGFSSANLIGTGSYGSVYKGTLCQDEGPIAVKVLKLMQRGASKSFMTECEALRGVQHRNLLKIFTVCSSVDFNGNDFKALVFQFMPNGNLESWLHPSSDDGQRLQRCLNLHQRLDIAIDVASALDYLHNDCEVPIVHCDLKSSNVLLDDDMTAHVADFGLAKFLSKRTSTSNKDETHSTALRGTIGYIPPEYGMIAEVSKQGDVYSYGIILLEMFTGKRPTDDMFKDGLSLHDFSRTALPKRVIDITDLRLLSDETHNEANSSIEPLKECLSCIIRIGVACSEELVIDRMGINDVLKELHLVKEVLSKVRD